MTFLAPWVLAIGALGAIGIVMFHLVARTRPAAYVLPTARFIPDQRSLVSRVATRPRDVSLLLLRVLLVLVASAAFARPVLTPPRGSIGHVVLVDRSRAVASMSDEIAKARALIPAGAPFIVIAFDSMPAILTSAPWDSLATRGDTEVSGSVSAALIAARRASAKLADQVDSVQLHLVSPLVRSEVDGATALARRAWPGAIDIQRSAIRADIMNAWQLSTALPLSDRLGPSLVGMRHPAAPIDSAPRAVSRLVRGALSPWDSAFARGGGTTVRWDTSGTARLAAEGLSVGDDVVVAALGRLSLDRLRQQPLSSGSRVVARWADGTPAAVEEKLGTGCVREVGVLLPVAGDLPLHPPFQRMVRGLLAPCGFTGVEIAIDASTLAGLVGTSRSMASAQALRARTDRPSAMARWLLVAAIVLALLELAVRSRGAVEMAT